MSEMQSNIYFRNQIFFWFAAFIVFLVFVWLFKAILLPFVLGIAIAYLLNPMVHQLGRVGFNRQAATIIILSGFIILVGALIAIFAPILYKESVQLARDLPEMGEKLENMIAPYQTRLQEFLGSDGGDAISFLQENMGASMSAGQTILGGLKAGGAFVTSFITIIVVVPFVAFFMMQEWPRVTGWVETMIPRPHKDTVLDLLGKMDTKLAGFVRGQITIALCLGILYAIALTLAGLKYGFLIGMFAGLFNIIPLVGSTLGLIVGIVVAWLQSSDLFFVALIGGIFIAGQILEGNFLTPKVLGDSVGLHPLWIFFALMAGAALFGIVGMLISIPVASVFSVLFAFMIERYKDSSYYLGMDNPAAPRPKKTKT
ncbi:MAG: AI-2E family transporter [Alphaproteobacteria bacterium]